MSKRNATVDRRLVSHQLRESILADGRTAYALGKDAEVDPGIIQRFLNQERGLTLDTMDRLALALSLRLVEGSRGRGRPSKPQRTVSRSERDPDESFKSSANGPLIDTDVPDVIDLEHRPSGLLINVGIEASIDLEHQPSEMPTFDNVGEEFKLDCKLTNDNIPAVPELTEFVRQVAEAEPVPEPENSEIPLIPSFAPQPDSEPSEPSETNPFLRALLGANRF